MDEAAALLENLKPHIDTKIWELVASLLLPFGEDLENFPTFLFVEKKRKELKNVFDEIEVKFLLAEAQGVVPLEAIRKLSLLHRGKCRESLLQMAKVLIKKSDTDFARLIYGDAATPEDADDIRNHLKKIFHPDLPWVLRIEDPQRPQLREYYVAILTQLSQRFDSCRYRNLSPDIAETNYGNLIRIGDHYKKLSAAYNRKGEGYRELIEEYDNLKIDSLSSEEISERKFRHANLAVSYYRSALRIIDKQVGNGVPTEELLKNQISVRNNIALALLLVGHNVNAQIYLVGAISIATKWYSDYEKLKAMLVSLQKNLTKIQELGVQSRPTNVTSHEAHQNVTKNPTQSYHLSTVLNNTMQLAKTEKIRALKNSAKKDRMQWITSYVLRSDLQLVPRNPDELIARSATMSTVCNATSYGFQALSVGSGSVAMSVIAATAIKIASFNTVATALALSGGPVTLVLSMLGLLATMQLSQKFSELGDKNKKERLIRETLNTMMEESHQFFLKGEIIAFFTRLSKVYDDATNVKLLEFVDRRKLEINSANNKDSQLWGTSIINRLLNHGFRSDGISYLLTCIAEGLLHGSLVFDADTNITTTSRIQMALKIYANIAEKDSAMAEDVRSLDEKVFELKNNAALRQDNAWSAWFGRIKALYIDGIPQSYVDDVASEQPFHARFEELQNMARLNSAILYVMTFDDTDSPESAREHLKAVQDSIRSNYQYFTISTERLNALQDLFIAFNISPIDEENSSPAKVDDHALLVNPSPGPNLYDPFDFVYVKKIKWGALDATCYGYEILVDDLDITFVLNKLQRNNYTGGDDNDLMQNFELYKAECRRNRFAIVPKGDDVQEIEIPSVTSDLLNAEQLQALFVQQGRRLVVKNLVPSNIKLINHLFSANFVWCAFHLSNQCYGPCDDSQQDINDKTVFIFCSDDKAGIGQFPPTIAFCASEFSAASDSKNLNDAKILNQLGEKDIDKIRGTSIAEGQSYWLAAKAKYRRSLDLQDRVFWRYALNLIVPSAKLMYNLYWKSIFREDPLLKIKGEISELEIDTFLRYIECVIGSTRITSALSSLGVLSALSQLQKSAKFWHLVALANRKLHLYENAIFAIQQSLKLDGTRETAAKEKTLLDKLHKNRIVKPVLDYFKKKRVNIEYNCEGDKNPSSTWYDIISIDGGGSLGIIPAMFIAEIEKRTKKPIAKAANLIAGTSTGAIIAGAVGCRSSTDFFKPRLSGQDLIELYADPIRLRTIFSPSSYYTKFTAGPKYSEEGRSSVIKEFVGGSKMKDTLTDLVITAVNDNQHNTKLFNRLEDPDCPLYDAIMASSAAPTYFPGHTVGSDLYVDGGLHANSPSQLAQTYAHQKLSIPIEKIRIWSLGTGNYCGDSNSVAKNGGWIHWAKSAFNSASNSQASNSDNDLHALLGPERYSRWQVWFDKKVPIDATDDDSILSFAEYGREFIEENDDLINRCAKCLVPGGGGP